ncbi:MAG: hypothetical protein ACREFN_17990 [Acetobacteraceae bacterium]
MKASIFGVALAMLLAAPAMAQTSHAVSQSGAAANSASGSFAATGSSSASLTQILNVDPSGGTPTDPTDPSGDPSGDPTVNNNVTYGGGYTVRNVPEVIPPSWGGQNVCAVGASGGVAVAGFGVSFGGMWSDSGCERRNSAVVLYQMGEHKAAVALMCQDQHVATAMQEAGDPCPGAVRAAALTPPAAPPRPARVAASGKPTPARAQVASNLAQPPEKACRMVFHYPTTADGRPDPNGAGWMQKVCG